ncbi:MAG: rhomboid family intramembrane serine protease [Bacteroidota bacterium]
MDPIQILNYIIIGASAFITYRGLQDQSFFQRYAFHVDPILIGKDYIRLISSGFLHNGWWHLLFNMYALYVFGDFLGLFRVPIWYYLILFLGSMLGGKALALYVHRNHGSYQSTGASGAVSGIVFAAVALYPGMMIWFVIPGWLFAILFTLVSIYGIRSQRGNIGHESHLGGAIAGTLLAVLWNPAIIQQHPLVLAGILLPTAIFLYLIISRPEILYLPMKRPSGFRVPTMRPTKPKRAPREAVIKPLVSPQDEIDALLDKGLENLSAKEKKRLETLSRQLNQGDS